MKIYPTGTRCCAVPPAGRAKFVADSFGPPREIAMNNDSIRRATLADCDALVDLFVEVANERLWIGTEPGFDREAKRNALVITVNGASGALFVAEADDAIVGQVGVYRHATNGLQLGMMVKDGYRGRGIGVELVRAAIAWARGEGEATLSLLVFPHNTRAIALYERCGFEHVERRFACIRRANGEMWDALAMTLTLTKSGDGAPSL